MKLEDWREEIDGIDREIVRLIGQRVRIVRKIGDLKARAGLPPLDTEREEAVLKNICGTVGNGINEAAIVTIYDEILRVSRRIQIPAGEPGSREYIEAR